MKVRYEAACGEWTLLEKPEDLLFRPEATSKGKAGRAKCAVRRSVVSPIQSGRTWKNVPGPNG